MRYWFIIFTGRPSAIGTKKPARWEHKSFRSGKLVRMEEISARAKGKEPQREVVSESLTPAQEKQEETVGCGDNRIISPIIKLINILMDTLA